MANQNDIGKVISTQQAPLPLEELIRQSSKELAKSLPRHLRPERVTQIALTAIRTNPELAKCTPASFLGALFVSAQLGLEPIAGNAYILPFNNSRKKPDGSWHTVKEAQFLIGYKGLATLFYRHEKAAQLNWGVVHQKDEFDYQYGTEQYLKHIPAKKDRGEAVGFYVIATLQGNSKSFMYMSKEECLEHGKKHSKTFDKKTGVFYSASPWNTNPDAMCLKTVLIQLAKLLPLSMELQQAISVDETSREYRKGIDNAMDLPDNTSWIEPDEKQIEQKLPVKSKSIDVMRGTITNPQLETINKLFKGKEDDLYEIIGGMGLEKPEQLSLEDAGKIIEIAQQ